MISPHDLNRLTTLIQSFQPPMTFFECDILLPAIRDRLEYAIEIFQGFQSTCLQNEVADDINTEIAQILTDAHRQQAENQQMPMGKYYLKQVFDTLERSFIFETQRVLDKYPLESTRSSPQLTAEFLNTANNLFQRIVGTRESAFLLSVKPSVSIKNTRTGKEVTSLFDPLEIVLRPFQLRMDELSKVASTSIDSIEQWGNQVRAQKVRHVEMIASLSQVKAAEQTAKAAKYSLYFQVAVIAFAVALTFSSTIVNLYLEKRNLEQLALQQEMKIKKLEAASLSPPKKPKGK